MPVLVIGMVGQTALEKHVTLGIPIRLCAKCRDAFEPASALTLFGKAQLHVQVAMRRGRRLNWDTLRVEWRSAEGAAEQIIKPILDKS